MSRPNPPCYQCTDRVVGCHASCDKYASFRTALDEHKNELFRNNVGPMLADGFISRQCSEQRRKP